MCEVALNLLASRILKPISLCRSRVTVLGSNLKSSVNIELDDLTGLFGPLTLLQLVLERPKPLLE